LSKKKPPEFIPP